ncbi:AMP-binding protein (plasmid) [Tistrella bauzanensis]
MAQSPPPRSLTSPRPPAPPGIVASPWHHALAQPDRPAVIVADTGETLSYGDMIRGANRLANLFVGLGLRPGDCVAFCLENHIRYGELVWAAKAAGLYYVCIARQSGVDDLRYVLTNCGARVFIASAAVADTAVAASRDLPGLMAFMIDGEAPGFASYEAAVAGQDDQPVEDRSRGASMLYSSGTTGRPKGIRHPLQPVSPHVAPPRHRQMVETYGFGEGMVLLNPGPLYHTGPLRFMMHAQRAGGTVIVFRKFDAEAVLRAISRHQVTHGLFVPTMFVRMLALPDAVKTVAELGSLRVVIHIAAPISIPTKRRMIDWFGPVLHEMYGGTESVGTTVITSSEWLAHPGSVGRPSAGTELHIVDEQGEECPVGVPGLIYMSSGKTFEYHGEAVKTAASRHAMGWYTLGDVGYVDDDGYLYLTDRQSNLIISGGVNIYPREVEMVLADHPAVADVAVLGVPDPDFGEAVRAVVVCRLPAVSGDDLARELMAFCRARLNPVKCPRMIDFVAELPRSEAGKILRADLRRRYWPEGAGLVV